MFARNFVRGTAEHRRRRGAKRRVLARQRVENRLHFRECRRRWLVRQRPPLQLQNRAVRIAAELTAAAHERRVQRAGTDERMRRLRLQRTIERLEPRHHAAEPQNRVPPFRRPAAVRRAPLDGDLDPRETFVADRDREVGRFSDDAAVRAPFRDERVGADARVFFVDDGGDDEAA